MIAKCQINIAWFSFKRWQWVDDWSYAATELKVTCLVCHVYFTTFVVPWKFGHFKFCKESSDPSANDLKLQQNYFRIILAGLRLPSSWLSSKITLWSTVYHGCNVKVLRFYNCMGYNCWICSIKVMQEVLLKSCER